MNLNSLPFLPEGGRDNSPGWSLPWRTQSGDCPPTKVVRPVEGAVNAWSALNPFAHSPRRPKGWETTNLDRPFPF
jgi:hypothetical protein